MQTKVDCWFLISLCAVVNILPRHFLREHTGRAVTQVTRFRWYRDRILPGSDVTPRFPRVTLWPLLAKGSETLSADWPYKKYTTFAKFFCVSNNAETMQNQCLSRLVVVNMTLQVNNWKCGQDETFLRLYSENLNSRNQFYHYSRTTM
jgi:hypothetical protein